MRSYEKSFGRCRYEGQCMIEFLSEPLAQFVENRLSGLYMKNQCNRRGGKLRKQGSNCRGTEMIYAFGECDSLTAV